MKWYLISVNHNGTISYLNEGSYKQMKKLDIHSFHRVTSISNMDLATKKFGNN
jgi:hypothetical protein